MNSPLKKILIVWLYALVACLSACQTHYFLQREQLEKENRDLWITSVQLTDGTTIDFRSDLLGYAVIRDTAIYRTLSDSSIQTILLSKVATLNVKRPNTFAENMTKGLLLASLGVIVLVVIFRSLHWTFG